MTFKSRQRWATLFLVLFAVLFSAQAVVSAPTVPNPVIRFLGTKIVKKGEKSWVRYRYDVSNKAEYPAELFAAAPDLPPCGMNTKATRMSVDVYDEKNKRLNGFCALSKPDDLGSIWFELESGVAPPSRIYIVLNDRKTNTNYKSNLAETTI